MRKSLKVLANVTLAASLVFTATAPAYAATSSSSSQAKSISELKSFANGKQQNQLAKLKKSSWKTEKNASSSSAKASFTNKNKNAHATDRVIVKYKSEADGNKVRSKYKVSSKKKLSLINAEVLSIPAGKDVNSFMAELKKDSSVLYVQPDYKVYKSEMSSDPLSGELWGLENNGQPILGVPGLNNIDIDAPEAWGITQGSNNVVVGVIDEGIDFSHPDLHDSAWTNPGEIEGNGIDDDHNGYIDDIHGWDFWNNDNSVFDPSDGDNHGTHVAGTIAASANNGIGIAGVAPNVSIMSLKFLGPENGYTSDAILAVQYAANKGVKITNNSWGGGSYDQALKDAIEASGSLFVAAAGNDGMNIDSYPHYPASYNSSNIITVAALDSRGNMAGFSNYGANSVDIAAPGVDILSTTTNNTYSYYNGTSMATPHVTGVAALLYTQDQYAHPDSVKHMLNSTGKVLPYLPGMVGSGRMVNAFSALTGTAPTPPPPPSNDDDIPGVPYNGYTDDTLDSVYDTDDVYSIQLNAGETIDVSIFGNEDTDFDLYLFSPDSQTVNTSEGILAFSENAGTSNESLTFTAQEAGTYYVDVFAYDGFGDYTLETGNGPGYYENDHPGLSYTGSWNLIEDYTFLGDSAQQLNSNGSMVFKFVGTDIEWIGFKNAQQGIANVWIDGQIVSTPSLYSQTQEVQQSIFKHTMPLGLHTIKIEWTGKRDSQGRKTATAINVDALNVSIDENADTEAPVVSNITPVDGSTVGTQYQLTGTATDNKFVDRVSVTSYYIHNGSEVSETQEVLTKPLALNKKSSTHEFNFDFTIDLGGLGASTGLVRSEVTATDSSGNVSDTVSLTYNHEPKSPGDGENPVIVELLPEEFSFVNPTFTVSGTAEDNVEVSHVDINYWYYTYTESNEKKKVSKTVTVPVKGTSQNAVSSNPYYFERIIDLIGAVDDGVVNIEAQAFDSSGSSSDIVRRTYYFEGENNSAPTFESIYPEEGVEVDSQFNITGTVSDDTGIAEVGVGYTYVGDSNGNIAKKVEIPIVNKTKTISANETASNTPVEFSIPVDLTGEPSGLFWFEIVAVDLSGNTSYAARHYYHRGESDTIAPVIESLDPVDGATVGSQFNITGTATDNDFVYDVWVDYSYTQASGQKVNKSKKIQMTANENNKDLDSYDFEIPIDLEFDGAAEGPVYIDAWAVDASDNESDHVYRTYQYQTEPGDYTHPSFSSVSPVDGATVPTQFNITGTVEDDTEVAYVYADYYYYYEDVNGKKQKVSDRTEKLTFNNVKTTKKVSARSGENKPQLHVLDFDLAMDLTGVPQGQVYVDIVASDTSGNTTYLTNIYHYGSSDTIAPEIVDLKPADGSTVPGQFNLTGTATDNDFVYDVWVNYTFTEAEGQKVNKSEKVKVNAGLNSKDSDSYDFEIPIDLVADGAVEGPVSIEAFAVDASGNESDMVYRTYDYAKPEPVVTRFENDDTRIVYNIPWTSMKSSNYSGGELRHSTKLGASAEFSFTGSGIRWVTISGPFYGLAEVYIDGIYDQTINIYNSTTQYQKVVYENLDLGPGNHVIKIVNKAEKGNPAGLETRISLDAFEVIDEVDTYPPVIEEVNPVDGSTVPAQFNITGKASDNVLVYDVWVNYSYTVADGLNVNKTKKTKVNAGLNSKNSDSYDFEIPIDLEADGAVEGPVSIEAWAIDEAGNESEMVYRTYNYAKPAPVVTRVENNDTRIIYNTPWTSMSSSNYSGGELRHSTKLGASAEFSFNGSGIRWVTISGPFYGLAEVYIDGVYDTTINIYNSTTQYQKVVYENLDLEPGNHTIKIVNKAEKGDPAGLETRISLDAFEVIGEVDTTPPPLVTRVENDDASIIYNTPWTSMASSNYSGGNLRHSTKLGASAEFSFTGSGIRWLTITGQFYGLAEVYIDGIYVTTINIYNSSTQYQKVVYENLDLAPGNHTIRIVNKAEKGDPAGLETRISLDAFEVIQ